MWNTRKQSVLKLATDVDRLAQLADALSVLLPNGAEAGAMLGQIADDIRESLKKGIIQQRGVGSHDLHSHR